jgi:NAD(P)H-hydrate repair Nnr-like enzyme with NAD(P)H-hydrate dehydratase domain
MTTVFNPKDLKKLYTPPPNSSGEDNGQVTIIAGSELFHGAPLLTLTVASRIVDMVFLATPAPSVGRVVELIKSKLFSFIWTPWKDVEKYIEKSDAVLIGPGMQRFANEKVKNKSEKLDGAGRKTRRIVERLLHEYAHKKWVIDAGALQTMDADWIPKGSIITPNKKEFKMLFPNVMPDSDFAKARFSYPASASNTQPGKRQILNQAIVPFKGVQDDELTKKVEVMARKHECIIVLKGPITYVSDGKETIRVKGGNAGLTKGGTGDVLAGLTVALLAKNSPILAATSASYIIKKTADEMFNEVGTYYNADDVSKKIPEVLWKLII